MIILDPDSDPTGQVISDPDPDPSCQVITDPDTDGVSKTLSFRTVSRSALKKIGLGSGSSGLIYSEVLSNFFKYKKVILYLFFLHD